MPNPNAQTDMQRLPLEQIQASISSARHSKSRKLERLTRTIAKVGVLHPILVRPLKPGVFEVIAGERRLLAAHRAGLHDVPVRVRTYLDDDALGDVRALEDALLENTQRERLTSLELAEAVLEVICLRLGETPAFVISRLQMMRERLSSGRSPNMDDDDDLILAAFDDLGVMTWRAFMARGLPLVTLPDEIKALVLCQRLNPYLAKALARVTTGQRMELLASIRNGLNPQDLRLRLKSPYEQTQRLRRLRTALREKSNLPNVQAALELLEQELGLA